MEYTLQPKHKSEVQFNGAVESESSWAVPYTKTIKNEFEQRFEKIKDEYDKLMDEVYWNNVVYGVDMKFKPVIGHTYHLYKDGDKLSLSMISPWEWKREHVASFRFDFTGKWVKI